MRARSLMVGALVLAAACASQDKAADEMEPQETATSAVITNRNLDVLVMVDDSSSMRLQQANLERNFPTFMSTLLNMSGGMPNIHVAVISSDMGAGDGSIAGCDSTGGKNGIFQYTPRGTCVTSPLSPGATYLSNVNGVANYTGDISAAFSCIAALGESGCGFENQFKAILRALGADGASPPAENQGFLRRDALLAIIMVTNEDDCSARPDVALYDVSSNTNLASQLGPPSNFRCNEFGHLCNGARPPRKAPGGDVAATVTLDGCTSSECGGALTPVAEFVARIKALKAAPNSEIVMAAIAGPAAPYTVQWKNPSISDTGPWPMVAHSCTSPDTSFADPGVRIAQAVSAFGANGFLGPICSDNFGPSLQGIAEKIGALLAAGGGTGGGPGPIPTCGADGGVVTGSGGAGGTTTGAGGAGASDAGMASGGRGGGGPADASVDSRFMSGGGGWCQVGGAGANGAGVAFVLMAWFVGRRRRPGERRARPPGLR